MHIRHGIFDEASMSVIDLTTITSICNESGLAPDTRRFRANIVLDTGNQFPFMEDEWVSGTLVFGDPDTGPMIRITMRDLRCMMINLDPDTAAQDPGVMKTVVRMNNNHAGVYGTVVRTGQVHLKDVVRLVM
jgi:uncharacterized protein YcbX